MEREKRIAYHVTNKSNLNNIKRRGLALHSPDDTIEEEPNAIYLFKTKEDLINGMTNWLGERIDAWEEENGKKYHEIYLSVDISNIECVDSADYEWECIEPIPKQNIIEFFDPNAKNADIDEYLSRL